MSKKDLIFDIFKKEKLKITAKELSKRVNLERSTVSRYLNKLTEDGLLEKTNSRPVVYYLKESSSIAIKGNFKELENIIGAKYSLQVAIQKAKAAILYPPRGLHTLILGETGVGKSMFAELMYEYAKKMNMIENNAIFVKFNCADYAENPQLLVSQIFGVKKGAYTGADKDKDGLLKKADGGILFLDEVHRLSPQGQEMLFTFIDKEEFRKLGETEKVETAKVQIIAATTEEPSSYLLKTFTRRIPMTITIPPLRERTVKERYKLIKKFIIDESKRLSKSIYVSKNAIVSMLAYECPNNIGQLKSDIQLSCAKAFLNYKHMGKDYIQINNADLPKHVKMGVINIKYNRTEIESLLKDKEDKIRFSYKDYLETDFELDIKTDFYYDEIEDKLNSLKQKGIDDEEIKNILDIDIEKHFQKYLGDFSIKKKREEIEKIVSEDVIVTAEYILDYAEKKLEKKFDEKLFYAFALHLHSSIERIRNGNKIYHPKLNDVRKNFKKEFLIAMELAKYIEDKFHIDISLDEIGYITMFIASKPYEVIEEREELVSIILMMHGNTTASSMMNVANTLVGTNHGLAIDMSLSMDVSDMYKLAKQKIMENISSKGVLLLVDMGSLVNFGDMLSEEVPYIIKTIDKISTPVVIEALRKAILGRDIYEIYNACLPKYEKVDIVNLEKEKIILSVCYTGEGASKKIKEILSSELNDKNIKIETLDILDQVEFFRKLEEIKLEKEVLAIISTVDIRVKDIPVISALEYFSDNGKEKLRLILENENIITGIKVSLSEHITSCDSNKLILDSKLFLRKLLKDLKINISNEVFTGVLLHICFLIDKKIKMEVTKEFENLNEFLENHGEEFWILKKNSEILNEEYGIFLSKSDLAYILYMLIKNTV